MPFTNIWLNITFRWVCINTHVSLNNEPYLSHSYANRNKLMLSIFPRLPFKPLSLPLSHSRRTWLLLFENRTHSNNTTLLSVLWLQNVQYSSSALCFGLICSFRFFLSYFFFFLFFFALHFVHRLIESISWLKLSMLYGSVEATVLCEYFIYRWWNTKKSLWILLSMDFRVNFCLKNIIHDINEQEIYWSWNVQDEREMRFKGVQCLTISWKKFCRNRKKTTPTLDALCFRCSV